MNSVPKKKRPSVVRRMLRIIGPGFITGAADDDPSGILTYAQTGAQFGLGQLWTVVLSLPFMITIQEMCGRIGIVTGRGLAGVIRRRYGRGFLSIAVLLLLVANTVNIGADLGAMASSAVLLTGLPFWFWLAVMAGGTLLLEVFIAYPAYARYLRWLTLSLLAYVVTGLLVVHDWGSVAFAAFIPTLSLDHAFLMNIVAVFGTTISPYLFFWEAGEEVEEEVARGELRSMGVGRPHFTRTDVRVMEADTAIGMIFSNLISFFIIVTAAATLSRAGITQITTAAEGAAALRPIAGPLAEFLFALGIIGTGLLAVPVLAGSASYAVAESLHWTEGLSKAWWQAKGFYGVIVLATVIGFLLNFIGIPPFRMLYLAAVLNGLIAPPLMVFILLLANDRKVMGAYRNRWESNLLGGIIMVFMAVAGVMMIVG